MLTPILKDVIILDMFKKTRLEILEENYGKKYAKQAELACKIMRIEGRIQIDNARNGKSTGHLVQTLLCLKDQYEELDIELATLLLEIEKAKEPVVHGSDI